MNTKLLPNALSQRPSVPTLTLYGLQCAAEDEQEVVRRVNASLDKIKRTTAKATNKTLLAAQKPFTMKHFFWNQHRDAGVFFVLVQNQDLKGKWHRPDHQDKGLLLRFSLERHAFRDGVPLKKPLQYIERVLRAVAVPYEKIAEGDELEDIFPARAERAKGRAKVSALKQAAPKRATPKKAVAKQARVKRAAAKRPRAKASAPKKTRSKP